MLKDQVKRIYVTDSNTVSIVCPKCGKLRHGTIKAGSIRTRTMRVRCSCGEVFPIQMEFRRHYRKKTHLKGMFWQSEKGLDHPVVIKNISVSGIGFYTENSTLLSEGKPITIAFELDDPQRSLVRKRVVPRRKDGHFIGCEFTSHQYHYDKAIAYYLMP